MTIQQMNHPHQHDYRECDCDDLVHVGIGRHCWWCMKPPLSHKASEEAG